MKDPGDILTRTLSTFAEKLQFRCADLPERRYIALGDVAYDCEQFTVHGTTVVSSASGQPGGGGENAGTATPNVATFHFLDVAVTIVREAAGLEDNMDEQPTAEDINASAVRAATDGKLLTEVFYEAFGPTADDIVGPCDNVWYGGITWNGPEGGLLASILTFQVQL